MGEQARRGTGLRPLRVAQIVPSFFPAHGYGGPIESVLQLCRRLALNGCEVRVLTTDADGRSRLVGVDTTREVDLEAGVGVRYCRRIMPEAVAPSLLTLLPEYVRWADVVHLTGVYSFPTLPTLVTCSVAGKPLVWTPRGSLRRWKGTKRLVLKRVWDAVCRGMAPARMVVHTTSEEEAEETVERLPGFRMAVIPNGIEIPAATRHVGTPGDVRLAYLGRLHAIKGIENLLAACAILDRRGKAGWQLTIAGSAESGYAGLLAGRIRELGLSSKAVLVGQVTGESKTALFENADVVVVPSHVESFGMVVAEALAHGVPVIASRGTPWRRVEDEGCGLWVENTPEDLAAAIEQMSRSPLAEMGRRGRAWMSRDFAWERVAAQMTSLYRDTMDRRS